MRARRTAVELLAPAVLVVATGLVGAAVSQTSEIYFVTALISVSTVVAIYVFVGNSGVLSFGHISFFAVGVWAAGVLSVPEEEKPALFQAADVFVMPAHLRAEALGLAQIEALASGLPCVSTELGTGTSFANRHGETGLVVPPGDAPALVAALNTLLADADLRQRFGAAGRQRVAALFTRAHMVDSVEAIYRDVLTAR